MLEKFVWEIVDEDMEDIDELEDLESKLLGSMEIEIPTSLP